MNGFRILALQDLSHILSAKSLQHETHASANTLKRCFWNFLNVSCKEENICETRRLNSSIVSYQLGLLEFKKEITQQSRNQLKSRDDQQKYDLSPSVELQFQDMKHQDTYLQKYLFLNMMKPLRIQQQKLIYFESLGTPQNPPSILSSVPHRVFSTKSCTVIQRIRTIEASKKDLNSASVSTVHLRSTKSHSGRVSLIRLQSFSSDASKSEKSADCKDGRGPCNFKPKECGTRPREVVRNRREEPSEKDCEKTRSRRETTRDQKHASSRDDTCGKRRESESKPCKRHLCPELQRKLKCNVRTELQSDGKEVRQKCDAAGRDSAKDNARKSRDPKCSQRDIDARCNKRQQSKSCKQREDRKEPRVVCTDPSKGKDDCRESKCEKRCEKREIREKGQQKCTGNNRRRSKSHQTKDSSRANDKSCREMDGKRRYSQQSIVSRDHRSFSTLIPTVYGMNIRRTIQRFYASCRRDEKAPKPFCEKPRKRSETEDETKKKCVKGPAKCLTRKPTADKTRTCQPTQTDEDAKPTRKSCYEEYCASKKEACTTKDEKRKEKLKDPPLAAKDKKPKEESMKEQIDREYREIGECKKISPVKKGDKKDVKFQKISTQYRPTGVFNSYKQRQREDDEKFTSTLNESLSWNSAGATHKSPRNQSGIINDAGRIIARDVGLFNMMFDRSFSTMKVNYQDDSAVERTAGHRETVRNGSANNSDFIHGDELPSYVEVENDEEEEDDEYDWATGRPVPEID